MDLLLHKKRVTTFALALLGVLCLWSSDAVAVSIPETAVVSVEKGSALGTVKGVVRDSAGSPIVDASVAIFHSGTTKLLKQVSSGRDGSFIAKIVPGTYTILAVAYGFNPSYAFGVDVGRSTEISYGFKLERAGSGNTLPEKRLDKNSSKWRIRAAQMRRAIYQNREGELTIDEDVLAEALGSDTEASRSRQGQTVFETYFSGNDKSAGAGVNFATLMPIGEASSLVLAGQTGTLGSAPHRIEAGLKLDSIDGHQLRFNSSITRIGSAPLGNETRSLSQASFQALDEWKVREGIIVVYGLDYSRFLGASDDSSLSPRIGLQLDLNPKTRIRSSFVTQTEEKTWSRSLDLDGQSIAFSEPVAIEDLFIQEGKARMNRSQRLEFGIERVIDNHSSIEANVFFDTTFARGVGLNRFAFDTLGGDGFGDMVANQQGRAQGVRVVYSRRLNTVFSSAVGYSLGQGQKLTGSIKINAPASIFENDFFHTFFAQVSADLRTGTSVRTIYRLSPRATVFAVDPFKGRLAIYDPGLSVYVTQSLPNLGLPFRAQAIVDARNLFDFQSGALGEEGGLTLNTHRRMFRGGIQVRF